MSYNFVVSKAEVEELLKNLISQDATVGLEAADALVKWGEPAVPILIEAFNSGDEAMRLRVAHILGQIGSPLAYEPMLQTLSSDPIAAVRCKAAWALWAIGDKRAVISLIHALKDGDPEVRAQVVWVLGAMEDSQAGEPLLAMLEDPVINVRRTAIWSLGNLKFGNALEPLIEALAASQYEIVRTAREAIQKIAHPEIGETTINRLIAAMKDERHQVAGNIIIVFERIGEPAIVPLMSLLGDDKRKFRELAQRALGFVGEPAIKPLLEILENGSRRLWPEAVGALGNIKSQQVVTPLVSALKNEYADVRGAAFSGLKELREVAIPSIIEILKDADLDLRIRGSLLSILMEHYRESRRRDSLNWSPDEALFIDVLRHGGPDAKMLAAEELGTIRSQRSYEALTAALEDWHPDVRTYAKRALVNFNVSLFLPDASGLPPDESEGGAFDGFDRLRQHALNFHYVLSETETYYKPIAEDEFLRRVETYLSQYANRGLERATQVEAALLWLPVALLEGYLTDVVPVASWNYDDGYDGSFTRLAKLFEQTPYQFSWFFDAGRSQLVYGLDAQSWQIDLTTDRDEVTNFFNIFHNLSSYLKKDGFQLYRATANYAVILFVRVTAIDRLKEFLISNNDFRADWFYVGVPHWWTSVRD